LHVVIWFAYVERRTAQKSISSDATIDRRLCDAGKAFSMFLLSPPKVVVA
jgi:hypothetical protein